MNVARQSMKDVRAIANMVRGLTKLADDLVDVEDMNEYIARLQSKADALQAEIEGRTATLDKLDALEAQIAERQAVLDRMNAEIAAVRGRLGLSGT